MKRIVNIQKINTSQVKGTHEHFFNKVGQFNCSIITLQKCLGLISSNSEDEQGEWVEDSWGRGAEATIRSATTPIDKTSNFNVCQVLEHLL